MKPNKTLIKLSAISSLLLIGLSACNSGTGIQPRQSNMKAPNTTENHVSKENSANNKAEDNNQLGATNGPAKLNIPVEIVLQDGSTPPELVNLKNVTINTFDWYYYEINAYAWQSHLGDLSSNAPQDATVSTSWTADAKYKENGFLFYGYVGFYFEREATSNNGERELITYATPIVFSEWYGNNPNKKFVLKYEPQTDCFKLQVPDSRSGSATNTTACAKSIASIINQ
ncbi:hypothetical protein [Aquella oligotrophica]|uniref:Lipoprotein n=1 Tax=Aquella oligotrophica TaxID=2067065 RepID=A0A2I7N8L5_9NEIS|nr:hypothetical protein [Aquella oligotrophica]AUR52804.1 hypothetical protein CUN60_11035 [Aquella oligotrophica]